MLSQAHVLGGLCQGAIPRHERLSVRDFMREYFWPNRPVILVGLADDWPARRKWTLAFLREHCGDVPVTCGRFFYRSVKQSLAQYIDYREDCAAGRNVDPERRPRLAMEGWYFRHTHPDLRQDYEIPPVFANDLIDKFMPERWDPQGSTIILSPSGTFTKLHRDLLCSHGWNTQLQGSKRWLLVSPEYTKDVYLETRQCSSYFPGTDVDAPDLEEYPKLAHIHYIEGVLQPGDTIFFPRGWLHQVHGLETSISLHHNYSASNNALPALAAFIQYRFFGRRSL